jgi:hypothetical protein
MATLTLTRALLALRGAAVSDLMEGTVLTSLCCFHGFDLAAPIHVQELPQRQGFHLTQ